MAGNTMEKAGQAEAGFISFAFRRGWEIAKPFSHAQGYDFIVRSQIQSWATVQVKAAFVGYNGRKRKPCRIVSLRRCNEKGNRRYKDGDFDFLFVWDGEMSRWFIPWDAVKAVRSSITLSNINGPSKRFADYKVTD